jgi:hypothetical protein
MSDSGDLITYMRRCTGPSKRISITTVDLRRIGESVDPSRQWATYIDDGKTYRNLPVSQFHAPEEGRHFSSANAQEAITGSDRDPQHEFIVAQMRRQGYFVTGNRDSKDELYNEIRNLLDPESIEWGYMWGGPVKKLLK